MEQTFVQRKTQLLRKVWKTAKRYWYICNNTLWRLQKGENKDLEVGGVCKKNLREFHELSSLTLDVKI